MAIDDPLSSPGVRLVAVAPAQRGTAATAVALLAVALAYYAAARLGIALRFPHSTPSVLWPPNALLTAILLLTTPRRWGIYLLAALPAHLIVELDTGWPPALVIALFLTNCAEALLAAGGVLWLTRASGRFDTVSRTVAFLVVAVVGATCLSSFPDAAVVWQVRGEPFWTVWQTRFFSNALAALTIVPAVVLTVREGLERLRRSARARRTEAALLALCVIVGGLLAFAIPAGDPRGGIGPVHDPLILTIPILLWAAIRFGPLGSSLALLFTTVIAIAGGMQGRGPFSTLAPETSVLALQLFLGAAGIPLLVLASASEERRRTHSVLQERLRFEELLSESTAAFSRVPVDQVDDALRHGLFRLCDILGAERGLLFLRSADALGATVVQQWHQPGLEPLPERIPAGEFAEIGAHLDRDESFVVRSAAELGPEQAPVAAWLRRSGVESMVVAPLGGSPRPFGGLAVLRQRASRWTDAERRTRLFAELFAGAMVRREAEIGRRAAVDLEEGLLSSLPHQVAILDRQGRILAVNESWSRFAAAGGSPALIVLGEGADYLEACRAASAGGGLDGTDVRAGVDAVLAGEGATFSCEYLSRVAGGERWFAMSVAPLDRAEGGAIVSHTDITPLKDSAAELAARRQELAHYNRVATMGELTASLAHELNQPLTAILLKAQTAQRYCVVDPPPADEVRPLLEELIAEARRASDVVRRSRELLSKQSVESVLDLHEEIRGVANLLDADARRRGVALSLHLAEAPAMVEGDRLQLQQVMLNLLVNALEASAGPSGAEVTVRTTRRPAEIEVVVSDSGPGIPPEVAARLFEPFFTTKSQGMGMGLAICRSIVTTHGGSIAALPNGERGAAFRCLLPRADLAAAEEPRQ